MAVNKKGHRKVNYKGQQYIWYVNEVNAQLPESGFVKPNGRERYLHIISGNKKFIVHYRLPKPGDADALLKVEGPLFPRASTAREVRVPRWRHDSKRYPTADFVRRLIQWCMTSEES